MALFTLYSEDFRSQCLKKFNTNPQRHKICSLHAYGKDFKKPNLIEILKIVTQLLKNYPIFPAIKCVVKGRKGSARYLMRPPLKQLEEKQSKILLESLSDYLEDLDALKLKNNQDEQDGQVEEDNIVSQYPAYPTHSVKFIL